MHSVFLLVLTHNLNNISTIAARNGLADAFHLGERGNVFGQRFGYAQKRLLLQNHVGGHVHFGGLAVAPQPQRRKQPRVRNVFRAAFGLGFLFLRLKVGQYRHCPGFQIFPHFKTAFHRVQAVLFAQRQVAKFFQRVVGFGLNVRVVGGNGYGIDGGLNKFADFRHKIVAALANALLQVAVSFNAAADYLRHLAAETVGNGQNFGVDSRHNGLEFFSGIANQHTIVFQQDTIEPLHLVIDFGAVEQIADKAGLVTHLRLVEHRLVDHRLFGLAVEARNLLIANQTTAAQTRRKHNALERAASA